VAAADNTVHVAEDEGVEAGGGFPRFCAYVGGEGLDCDDGCIAFLEEVRVFLGNAAAGWVEALM